MVDGRARVRDLRIFDDEPIVPGETEAALVLDRLAPVLSGASRAAAVHEPFATVRNVLRSGRMPSKRVSKNGARPVNKQALVDLTVGSKIDADVPVSIGSRPAHRTHSGLNVIKDSIYSAPVTLNPPAINLDHFMVRGCKGAGKRLGGRNPLDRKREQKSWVTTLREPQANPTSRLGQDLVDDRAVLQLRPQQRVQR